MKYRDVVARLKRFGVAEYAARGKGSERLVRPEAGGGVAALPPLLVKSVDKSGGAGAMPLRPGLKPRAE